MKNLTYAKEVILESRRLRNLYKESGRDFHKIKSHMYSIFECYASNLIEWNDVKILWKESIKKYLNLYENDSKLHKIESARMRKEYRETLDCKTLLDEYRTYIAEKNVKKIVEKISVTESQAVDVLLNRTLSIRSLKEISQISSWEKVMESFPMLRKQDEERIRMLTIFENDMFNVTGWSKLNEGPTLDTTQMITTVMSEAPTPRMNPADIRATMSSSPSGMGNQRPAMVGSIVGGQIGRMAGKATGIPGAGMVGRAIGSQIGSRVGTNIAMNRANASNLSVAAPTLSTSGSKPSATAPTTSMRPKPRPVATEDAPKTSIRPVARPGRSLPGGGYQWPNGAVEPGAGAKFITDMPTPKARPANLTKSNTPAVGSNLAPTTSIRPQRRPASNVGRREMSPTPGVWDGSTRGFESVQQEGYKTIKSIDKERYDEIPGLEGPFMTLSGKVVYYDPKEGSYYDRDTDMYLSYEEFKELDNDYSGMKNTREIKEAEEGTYMKQWYDYSEDFAMLELYVDGKLVDQWNDYFGANVTGNPLQQKFIDMAKKNGVDPIGLKVIDGENGNEGVFTSRGLKWNSTEAKAKPGTMAALKGLKAWEVSIGNNYYNGRYADWGFIPYPVLATSADEAKQVVLDNANAILKDLLSKKSQNGKRLLPPRSALPIEAKHIGRIEDGTVKGRRSTLDYKTFFSPQGPMTVKLENGNIVDIQESQNKGNVSEAEVKEAKTKPGHNARAMARAQDIIRKGIEQSQKNVGKKDDEKDKVDEAVTLDYSRHVRSHGKKPRDPGYSALWMFTTREYDMPDDDEIFKFQGSFADAKKAAAQWAKSQGAYRVYVME